MGSAIGAALSYKQHKDGKSIMKKYEAKQEALERQAELMTPAEAQQADVGDAVAEDRKRRRGVQSTFVASKQESGTVGA